MMSELNEVTNMGANFANRIIVIQQPRRLVFGNGCVSQFVEDFAASGLRKAFIITAPPILPHVEPLIDSLKKKGTTVSIWDAISSEPTIDMFEDARRAGQAARMDAVIGVGGGSVLDVAKLVAALHDSKEDIRAVFGIGKLSGRNTYLACLPTTAGTGSEVSPNAIILDEAELLKKGVVSPHLVPDASYVDPLLTKTVPPDLTASTGMDALTHCVESYANLFAHPIIDIYAMQGIKLIGANLKLAYENGENVEARTKMSLGSLYGGLCLGPVNTGAVHALSYPLGGEFHVSHGVSNSLLLPYVLEFNIPAMPERYAQIAIALGVEPASSDLETAQRGLERIKQLSHECNIPAKLSGLGVPREAIKRMAESAMTVTRLLKNNPRELKQSDAEKIYEKAY
jgi:alcohol dehydrogenase class IV